MSLTFKKFLEDITVDDTAYGPDESQDSVLYAQSLIMQAGRGDLGRKWKDLDVIFPLQGFKVVWGNKYIW